MRGGGAAAKAIVCWMVWCQVELHALPGVDKGGGSDSEALLGKVWRWPLGPDPGYRPPARQAHPAAQWSDATPSWTAIARRFSLSLPPPLPPAGLAERVETIQPTQDSGWTSIAFGPTTTNAQMSSGRAGSSSDQEVCPSLLPPPRLLHPFWSQNLLELHRGSAIILLSCSSTSMEADSCCLCADNPTKQMKDKWQSEAQAKCPPPPRRRLLPSAASRIICAM